MRRNLKIIVPSATVLIGIWFYATPYLAFRGMQSAAEGKDVERLANYINFPSVREGLKSTLNAKVSQELGKANGGDLFSTLAAATVATTATAMVNQMVDAYFTPEALTQMMKGGGEKPEQGKSGDSSPESDIEVSSGYETFNRFVTRVKKKNDPGEPFEFVLNREGLVSWKLTTLRIPL